MPRIQLNSIKSNHILFVLTFAVLNCRKSHLFYSAPLKIELNILPTKLGKNQFDLWNAHFEETASKGTIHKICSILEVYLFY